MRILTLTLNPAFDTHCFTPVFRPDHENIAEIIACEAGGKGVNISRALRAFDGTVSNTALVVVGGENGETYLGKLREDGLCVQALTVPGRIRENLTLHQQNGPETRISFPGFRVDAALSAQVAACVQKQTAAGDILTMTGSLPTGMDKENVMDLLADARDRGVRVVIDSRSFTRDDLFALRPWLVKPNEDELAAYLGKSEVTSADVREAAAAWHAAGIENVMVSRGEKGACLCTDDGWFTASAPRIRALSTIGAGDSSVAGFVWAFASGKRAEECLRAAVAFGSAACLTPGTNPPKKEDVLRFLSSIT